MKLKFIDESPWLDIQIVVLIIADIALVAFLVYLVCTLTSFLSDFIPKWRQMMYL